MQGRTANIKAGGEDLELLSEGAIYWPSQAAVLVADLHIGKGAAFRAGSVPVPTGSSEQTLFDLSELCVRFAAKTLYILGDFWHAREGRTALIEGLVTGWRSRHSNVEMILVEGNHDVRAGDLPTEWDIRVEKELLINGLVLKHHPEPDDRGYVLAGHIHPAVRMIGRGRQIEKLPAFLFGPQIGVLPAFGAFTGDATVYPAPGDRVFVIADHDVVEVGLTGAGV